MNAKASVYLPFEGWALRSLSGSQLSTCTESNLGHELPAGPGNARCTQ